MNSTFALVFDILMFLLEFTWELLSAFFRLFVPPDVKSLQNEIVLITGAGHGIGRELALEYHMNGCKVICVDLNEENNVKTVNELNSRRPSSAFGYVCDVSNREQVLALGKNIQAEIGTVTVLCNNAGIMPSHPLQMHTPNEIKKIMDVNVFAHFWMLEAFLPEMIKKKRGHIVALSSIAGVVGLTNLVPYCASKFAVRGLMESLQTEINELHPNVDFNCTTICPYMVDTGLCKKPKIRFPSMLGLLTPSYVAKTVVDAHKRNKREITIPNYLMSLNNVLRPLPYNCGQAFRKFMDSGVESDVVTN